jgi:TPR repeat protein
MKYSLIALVLLLSACASSPSQQGLDMLNMGHYQGAYNIFVQCSNQGDSNCINNIGYMYQSGHMDVGKDMDTAIRYYTLAARYGNPTAQRNLAMLGAPIPTVDLVAQQTPNDDAIWAALLLGSVANGYSGYIEAQQEARDKQQIRQMQEQMNKPVRCSSRVENSGDVINTTCHQ